MLDHYADAVFSEPGRCWRMVYDGEGSGRPRCTAPPGSSSCQWVPRLVDLGPLINSWAARSNTGILNRPVRY